MGERLLMDPFGWYVNGPWGPMVGPKDQPCSEGRHVDYQSPEWLDMLADARACVAGVPEDPCDEVARNLAEMKAEDERAARDKAIRAKWSVAP